MTEFSVIIPVYNVEPYLRECIDSALSQTFADFELIIVDDGSPDKCGSIIDEYAKRDSRIRVIHKPNGGLSSARNAGLDIATGKYIYFCDSDDVMLSTLLETVYPEMESGYDMVVFNNHVIPPKEKKQKLLIQERTKITLENDEDRYRFIIGPLRRAKIRWEVWNRCFRREVIEKWHIRFADNNSIFAEDFYFVFCYVAHISKILLIPDILYDYRIRDDSIMAKKRDELRNLKTSELLADAIADHYKSCGDCGYLAQHDAIIFALRQKGAIAGLRKLQWKNRKTIEWARNKLKESVSNYPEYKKRIVTCLGDPEFISFFKDDNSAITRIVNRIYMEELFDYPASRGKTVIRKILLNGLSLVWYIKNEILFKRLT